MWRPKDSWQQNPCIGCPEHRSDNYGLLCDLACGKASSYINFEAGADAMHKADVSWLIERIIHDDRGYVFKMTDKEWQEFIE